MKEKLNRLAKGMIDTSAPSVKFGPEQFCEEINPGEPVQYVLNIEGADGAQIKGLCYSDNPRVRMESSSFVGRRCHLLFTADASFLAPGTLMYGNIGLITNAGEFSIPYRFTVAAGETLPESGETVQPQSEAVETEEAVPSEEENAYLSFLAAHFPEDDQLMEELCALFIREDRTEPFAFSAYEEAVRRDLSLTRLYEAYLNAYPDDRTAPLPRQLLLYFSYDNGLSPRERDILYQNVLLYVEPDAPLYTDYLPQMRDYTMYCVLNGRINDRIALLYDRMIYPNMIDKRAARILPDILKCCRITCKDARAAGFYVQYPELVGAERHSLTGGRGYAPVYFENAEIICYDKTGQPLRDAEVTRTPLLHKPELLKHCFELAPGQPMQRLSAAKEILGGGALSGREKEILCDVLKSLPLSADMRDAVVEKLCDADLFPDWISAVNPDSLSDRIRTKLLQRLLTADCPAEACQLLKRYGLHLADTGMLHQTAKALIEAGRIPKAADGEADPFFLSLCKKLFDEQAADAPVLGVLTAYYEGASEDMYAILEAAARQNIPLFELAEKILIIKLFSGSRTHIDETFAAYAGGGMQKELIVRAYLTVRSYDYFCREEPALNSLFEALYSYLSTTDDPNRLPEIYLLALTKHYAETEDLLNEEKALCQKLTDLLIEQGLVFPYTKQLKKKIAIPAEICERYYLEYHGDRELPPRLLVKISPQEEEFHAEEMRRVYQGIYVWSTVLFMGERLSYLIYPDRDTDEADAEGVISVRKIHKGERGRIACLNEMTKALLDEDYEMLRQQMESYYLKDQLSRALFAVGENE